MSNSACCNAVTGKTVTDATYTNLCAKKGTFADLQVCTQEANVITTDTLVTEQLVVTGPLPSAFVQPYGAYAGPESLIPPVLPATFIQFNIAPGQQGAFFAVSDLNSAAAPVGQDVFAPTGETSTVNWTLGSTSLGGTPYIETLPPGTYDVGFSASVNVQQNDTSVIMAVGLHTLTPGGTFEAPGTPIPHPTLPGVLAISAFVGTEATEEIHSLSARGSIVTAMPLSKFGLVVWVDKDGDPLLVTNINFTVTRIE